MPASLSRPWRSVWLPRAVTAIVLIVGLPLYLRMPLWCDLTLYDLAARNLLDGGVHYRDVFDTNFPGFVWLLTGIRWLIGFGAFPLRCVDLAIVTAIIILVDRVARRGGATPWARWWAIAGATLLYLSSVEMAHCQRDTWMALPAVVALLLRLRRAGETDVPPGRAFAGAAIEGALWAVELWIKPNCALMAVGVWVVKARRVAYACSRPRAGFAADLLGNVFGGAIVGLAGVAVLVASGSWPHFWEVVTVWAPEYTAVAQRELEKRMEQELHWFPPWSLLLVPTVPLALLSILDGSPWCGRPRDGQPGPVGRLLPGWLWTARRPDAVRARRWGALSRWACSFYIQRVHVRPHGRTLLMFGLWAAHCWALPAAVIAWLTLTSAAWLVGDVHPSVRESMLQIAKHDSRPAEEPDIERYFVRYPLADMNRLRVWCDCWKINMTDHERYILWDRLRRIKEHEATIDWEEMEEVADFLRKQCVKDYELLAWHDSPHALYLMLGIKPGVRYLHVNTVQLIGWDARARVQGELACTAGKARFAVSDLEFPTLGVTPAQRLEILGPPAGGTTHPGPPRNGAEKSSCNLLPAGLPASARSQFPFNQPTVFRSRGGLGRYVVHELRPPLGDWPFK